MKMTEIREKARSVGLKPRKMRKVELVRAIQKREGVPDCYGRSQGHCGTLDCCFRSDCIQIRS